MINVILLKKNISILVELGAYCMTNKTFMILKTRHNITIVGKIIQLERVGTYKKCIIC